MPLWQKESSKEDAFYIDIFNGRYDQKLLNKMYEHTKVNISEFKKSYPSQKNNKIATDKLLVGNALFVQECYSDAIEQYNKCLCFAITNSEIMSLAYVRRSECYFQMKMYDKCIIDIDLAIKINSNPQQLISVLNKRRSECENQINAGHLVQTHKPKLSFEPNEHIAALANSIKIDVNQYGTRRLIAIDDLCVGQTIFLEPSYVGELYAEKYTSCNICLNLNENFIPCEHCTVAMFCHEKCEHNNIHQFECSIKPCAIVTHVHAVNIQIPMIRSIMLAIRAFSTIDDFIEFVEQTINSPSPKQIQFNNVKSKYKTFLKLPQSQIKYEAFPLVYSHFKFMLDQPKIAKLFNTKKYQRFLMHLILHHHLIFEMNITHVGCTFQNPNNLRQCAYVTVTNQFSILQSLFRHSCTRNVGLALDNGSVAGIVLRPIQAGEELYISFHDAMSESFAERQKYLWQNFRIQCMCELCESRTNSVREDSFLRTTTEYIYICMESHMTRDQLSQQRVDNLTLKCVTFLQRYGRYRWCKEIEIVINVYLRMLQTRKITISLELFVGAYQQNLNWN